MPDEMTAVGAPQIAAPAAGGSERRGLLRVPSRIVVTQTGKSHLLGEIRNLSLSGVFIASNDPLPEGSNLSISFSLRDGKPDLVVQGRVVWRSSAGLGLEFLHLSSASRRRLRRTIVELASVVGHRETAIQLHDLDEKATEPIRDPTTIRDLFRKGLDCGVACTIIAAGRQLRETGTLHDLTPDLLHLRLMHQSELNIGEKVFLWMTVDFVSYSFEAEVRAVQVHSIALTVPKLMYYSERRTNRRQLHPAGKSLVLPLPWQPDRSLRWPIVDIGPGGLSFRVGTEEALILPGTPLTGALLEDQGKTTSLPLPVVRHLTLMQNDGEAPWLKVGVAYQLERVPTPIAQEVLSEPLKKGPWHRFQSRLRGLASGLSYLYHSRLGKRRKSDLPFQVVRYLNRRGQQVVGLLNLAFPAEGKVRAPLILVTPGYGGRKEVMSGLAMTIVHNFRLHHQNVAVLRLDNTNNLGESDKDPGCEQDGSHTLHYTMSGGVEDLLGALDWADRNPFVEPTDILVISISLSSVPVRRLLTLPEAARISYWIAFMGVADAQDAALHAAGNIDMYGNYLRGVKNGVISLLGCLVDADHYCRDLEQHHLATIDDARADMAQIRAAVTWLVGKHDGWLDPRRVRDIMEVKAPGSRHILEVDAGHVPRSGEEALAEFALMSRLIWRHLFGRELEVTPLSAGWLAAVSDQEWQRVRRTRLEDRAGYWKSYLLGENDLGFDIVELSSAYRQFVETEVKLAQATGKRVLDLGAGTGNVSVTLQNESPAELVCLDIVPEALEKLEEKVGRDRQVTTVVANADGSPLIAMKRWLAGDLAGLPALAGRIPGVGQSLLDPVGERYTPELHALLRGSHLDAREVVQAAGLPLTLVPVLSDLNLLARVARGHLDADQAAPRLRHVHRSVLDDNRGLPFPDGRFDCVMCSIVLSYLDHPQDTLFEIHRVLAPGGRLVVSTMKPDADISKLVLGLIDQIEAAPESDLPAGYSRSRLLKAARDYISSAANLVRLEEEGLFRFFGAERFLSLLGKAGFDGAELTLSFGDPPQALVVLCHRP
ncbi:MAG: PilZ domain-containing protein [Bradymonadales bacterium]|nr:PilZ domain-containing protein [Bradymonadales bacterium]